MDGKCEINFWLNKQGGNLNTVRLNILTPNTQGGWTKSRLWAYTGKASNDWQQVTVGIGARKAGFMLEFESIKLLSAGTIAVDDVAFNNCAIGMPILTALPVFTVFIVC